VNRRRHGHAGRLEGNDEKRERKAIGFDEVDHRSKVFLATSCTPAPRVHGVAKTMVVDSG
jgi:hypothetical protein